MKFFLSVVKQTLLSQLEKKKSKILFPYRKKSTKDISLILKDPINILCNLIFLNLVGKRDFFHEKIFRRIKHLSLAKGEVFIFLQKIKIAQYTGDFENRPGFDFLHILAISLIPRLGRNFYIPIFENIKNPISLCWRYNLSQTNVFTVLCRNHNNHA